MTSMFGAIAAGQVSSWPFLSERESNPTATAFILCDAQCRGVLLRWSFNTEPHRMEYKAKHAAPLTLGQKGARTKAMLI